MLPRPPPAALFQGTPKTPGIASNLLQLCAKSSSTAVRAPLRSPVAQCPFSSLASRPRATQRRTTTPQTAQCPPRRFPSNRTPPFQRRPYRQPTSKPDPDLLARASRIRTGRVPLLTRLRAWWYHVTSRPLPSTLTLVLFSSGAATVFYFAHLETVPISGRTRFNIFSEESVRKVGEMEYRLLLDELREKGVRVLPPWDWRVIKVKKVMERLLPFSGVRDKWGEQWEVVVVDDDRTANAFVLPGGKVFVFSGILRLAGSDAGLATVLGHEIAHNLAGHHAERMSQDFGAVVVLGSLVLLGGVIGIAPFLIGWFGTGFWKGLLDVVFGLPMSRLQESEADYIGLMMMAEACYDPREAVKFWARMEMATGGDVVPEVMSTHPTNINRIKKIQKWLPQAMERRENSDCRTTASFADLFAEALRRGIILI